MIGAKTKIAILTNADPYWMLPAWADSLPHLGQDFEVVGMWVFPDRLGKLKGPEVLGWYLRVFGTKNVLLLATFSVMSRLRSLFRGIPTWERLGEKNAIPVLRADNPNQPEVITWLKDNKVEIALTSVSTYLKPPVLSAPILGSINKHAALLPASKGVFPYVWSILEQVPLGVTYHQMAAEIDGGPFLLQWPAAHPTGHPPSMLRFYHEVFSRFPRDIHAAALAMKEKRFLPPSTARGSYFSLPERKHIVLMEKMGGRIARSVDLFYIFHAWLTRR